MGGGQPNVCATSSFRAVLFWFVYDASAVRRPALAIGGLFGRESCLIFDWWKHFWKILGRSEVAIGLTRRLGGVEASEFAPLWCCVVFFCFFVFFSDAPSPCV